MATREAPALLLYYFSKHIDRLVKPIQFSAVFFSFFYVYLLISGTKELGALLLRQVERGFSLQPENV